MARRRKTYDDDDGRTIVDMSAVEKPNLLSFNPAYMDRKEPTPQKEETPQEDRPWEAKKDEMPKELRRAYVWGALKASLLIGAAFGCGLGLVIYLITLMA